MFHRCDRHRIVGRIRIGLIRARRGPIRDRAFHRWLHYNRDARDALIGQRSQIAPDVRTPRMTVEVQMPWLAVADTNVTPVGSTSSIVTLVAWKGPLFFT